MTHEQTYTKSISPADTVKSNAFGVRRDNRLGVADERSGKEWWHFGASGRRTSQSRRPAHPSFLVPLDVRHCDGNMSSRESGSELSRCHSRINRFFHGLLNCDREHHRSSIKLILECMLR